MKIKNWQVFIHDKGMMVPGILGKYGRAFDHLNGITESDKGSNIKDLDAIRKISAFIVSRVMTSHMEGTCSSSL